MLPLGDHWRSAGTDALSTFQLDRVFNKITWKVSTSLRRESDFVVSPWTMRRKPSPSKYEALDQACEAGSNKSGGDEGPAMLRSVAITCCTS